MNPIIFTIVCIACIIVLSNADILINPILFTILSIVGIIIITDVIIFFAKFFGIEYNTYCIYLYWFLTICLFIFILPKKRNNIFE